jgi:hypothetical protein
MSARSVPEYDWSANLVSKLLRCRELFLDSVNKLEHSRSESQARKLADRV